MPKFRFVALDAKGTETEGVLDAANQSEALALLRARDLFPTSISQIGGPAVTAQIKPKEKERSKIQILNLFKRRVSPKELMVLTRQLATLVESGLPLLRGLRILVKQESHPLLRQTLSELGDAIESGSTFSEALAQHPKIFNDLFINMVKAGEAGGVLEEVLSRLAEFMEKAERIKGRIKSAMIYPIVVLCAAVIILTIMLTLVVPKFQAIFADILGDEKLPGITIFVIETSRFVKENILWIIGGIIVLIVGIIFAGKTKKGRYIIDTIKLNMPVIGQLYLKTAVGRFARTLSTLITSGVPILQALNIVRDTAGNSVIARGIQAIHDAVKEGEAMASQMSAEPYFPELVVGMVEVGEETGKLPEMLAKVAENYEEEVDRTVEGLTSIIEPIMIIFLAIVIGTLVISMFLPLIKIIQGLTGPQTGI